MKLSFQIDEEGNEVLSDHSFRDEVFDSLELNPPLGRKVILRRCQFLGCSTSTGTCYLGPGVTLDRVVFSNFDCGDAMRIDSHANLSEVVVRGDAPSLLLIKPGSETDAVDLQGSGWMLDISDFSGEVSIVGIPSSCIRKDAERHVVVKASWREEVDWKSLGIGPFSYWRIFIKKVSSLNATEGLFSLPPTSDKHYRETIEEKKKLEALGLQLT